MGGCQWILAVGSSPLRSRLRGTAHLCQDSIRQSQILNLLAAGRSNREIAADLFVAEGTVKAHVHQLYGKLMARNRIEAIANARQLGLIAS